MVSKEVLVERAVQRDLHLKIMPESRRQILGVRRRPREGLAEPDTNILSVTARHGIYTTSILSSSKDFFLLQEGRYRTQLLMRPQQPSPAGKSLNNTFSRNSLFRTLQRLSSTTSTSKASFLTDSPPLSSALESTLRRPRHRPPYDRSCQ
jgi:hypothetical protein